jgi:hypothetical protein
MRAPRMLGGAGARRDTHHVLRRCRPARQSGLRRELALSLVARALKKLLLLVFAHFLAPLLDHAAQNDTSTPKMREDV